MYQAIPVDGFRLAYERIGRGPAVVLLHGWPGDRTDYREVVPLVSPATDVVVPDLRGFGQSDKHRADPAGQYSADAQARSVIGLIDELGLDRPVIGGYDIGSRIAQTVARGRPPASFWLIIDYGDVGAPLRTRGESRRQRILRGVHIGAGERVGRPPTSRSKTSTRRHWPSGVLVSPRNLTHNVRQHRYPLRKGDARCSQASGEKVAYRR
jgi:pimeloyl-ACP methyl ester carboxylesterase